MPTANTSTRAKAGTKTAAKATKARARKAPKRKVRRTKAASTRSTATHTTQTSTRWPIAEGSLGDYAERAVLIPVGAALTARDRVVASVNDTLSTYSSTTKAQAQLRRFERRGATARKRLEREVRKTRVRVERELRQRRREIVKTVSDLEDRREAVAKNSTEFANRVPDLANRVPELANRVQERILSLV